MLRRHDVKYAWILAAAAACSHSSDPAAVAGSAERTVGVQVAKVEQKDLPIWLEGLGTVAAVQQVTVRPQVDGRLDKVFFKEGQAVKAGDVLAQIDPRPFQVALEQAQGALARDKAQLDTAKKSFVRYQELQKQNLVAAQQVEQYEAQVGQYEGALKMDQAQIDQARLNLDYARINAPIDGVTTRVGDEELVRTEARLAESLGFRAKFCIHPAQVPGARAGLAPTDSQISWAHRILAAATDGAARTVDGAMVDRPVEAKARNILRRASAGESP